MKIQDFCHIFIIDGILIGGGSGPSRPPGYAYDCISLLLVILRFCVFFACLPLRACQSIGVARIFDWGRGGPNRKLHAMTSSETLKRNFLWGQRYRRMEDQKTWPGVGA